MLKKLWSKGFRNLKECVLEFSDASYVIVGENNQGKTSLLESIYVAICGRSPIEDDRAVLVSWYEDHLFLGLDFDDHHKTHRVSSKITKDGVPSISLDNRPMSLSNGIQDMCWIEFIGSDDWKLFKESPSYRRSSIDAFCIRYFPQFQHLKKKYDGIIRQKNRLLSLFPVDESQLDIWNQYLLEYAVKIVQYRQEGLYVLQEKIKEIGLSQGQDWIHTMHILYQFQKKDSAKEISYSTYLHHKITQGKAKEIQAKLSLYGPHRDDFDLYVHDRSFHKYHSRGIQKMVSLWFKWAHFFLLEEISERFPILLLDDTFSEMDFKTKKMALANMDQKIPIFYTTIQESDKDLFDKRCLLQVKEGVVLSG